MNNETYYLNTFELNLAVKYFESNLSQVSFQAKTVSNSLWDFSNSSLSTLIGGVWDTVRNSADFYGRCIDISQEINDFINKTNIECVKLLQDFLEPDQELNTADLHTFEQARDDTLTSIKSLQAKIDAKEWIPDYTDFNTGAFIPGHWKYIYSDADRVRWKREIDEILQPRYDGYVRLINKINSFINNILPAIDKLYDEAEEKANNFFDYVSGILNSMGENYDMRRKFLDNLLSIDNLEEQYKAIRENRLEDTTPAARFLYTYDLLTKKYGFSEWGAKAVLANMYGTNKNFDPTSPQYSADGTICGPAYGLTQLEWDHIEYEENGRTYFQNGTGTANIAKEWCDEHGYDFNTIDGQVAYLALEGIKTRSMAKAHSDKTPEGTDLWNMYDMMFTATEEDYDKLVQFYGNAIQGSQSGGGAKHTLRGNDGDFKYALCSLIDEREYFGDIGSLQSYSDNVSVQI